MKKKSYEFHKGRENQTYISEIKKIMMKNPDAETVAGFSDNGNYIIEVYIPDWRDKFKKDSLEAIKRQSLNKTYGNWANNSKSYQQNARDNSDFWSR